MVISISSRKFAGQKEDHSFAGVESIFSVLMVITACAMAFAHGSNDVANAIGPLSAVVSTVQNMGELTTKSAIAWWDSFLWRYRYCGGSCDYGLQSNGNRWYGYYRTNS